MDFIWTVGLIGAYLTGVFIVIAMFAQGGDDDE